MNFHIARAAAVTGNLLKTLVEAELKTGGIKVPANAEICYGVGYGGTNPALNASCSRYNKMEQARRLQEGLRPGEGLRLVTVPAQAEQLLQAGEVLFARTLVHSKGRDIRVVLEPWQVRPLLAAGSSFFTVHEPSVREFRTWVYRKRHLGTYEKALTRPQDCKRLGRNYENGFDFNGMENDAVPDGLKDVARRAIAVLGLDFGAVDLLQRADGTYCVLEVNSAPGVSHERRRVITGLATRITKWIENGCPAREA